MNKKAIIMANVIDLIILIIFFAGMLFFVYSRANSASLYEDYYAKEIAKIIDYSKPGDKIILDVQVLTEIAKKNKVANFEEIFSFDNLKNQVCIKLTRGSAQCFNYFNKVSVGYDSSDGNEKWVYYAESIGNGETANRLHFVIREGLAG